MIYERNYLPQVITAASAQKSGAPKSAAPITGNLKANPWGKLATAVSERSKELITKYKVIRGSQYSLAVKLKLNKDEEVDIVPDETIDEPVVEDPKAKKGKK